MSGSIYTDHYNEWARLFIAVHLIDYGWIPSMYKVEAAYTRQTGRSTLRSDYRRMGIDYFRSKPE